MLPIFIKGGDLYGLLVDLRYSLFNTCHIFIASFHKEISNNTKSVDITFNISLFRYNSKRLKVVNTEDD